MADIKLENLPQLTAIAANDLIPFTSDPTGTPLSKNITRDNLFQYLVTKSLYDAYSILMATTEDTPVALTVNVQEVVGRLTDGAIDGIALGIADDNVVQIDSASVADGEIARFTANGLESRSNAEMKTQLAYMTDLVDDATPQLGGDLDLNGKQITNHRADHWTLVPAANYTATPASTSTITMGTDMTAVIKVGMPLEYADATHGTYYGRVAAITSNLLTVNGPAMEHDLTSLKYGGGTLRQLTYDATVNVDGTANTTTLKTGTVYTLTWRGPTGYVVFYDAYQTTHDSNATHGKVTIKVNGTDINTSAGGLVIAANATVYKTIVDIALAAYDINEGEDLTIVVTQGGTADGAGLRVNAVIVTP